MGGPTRGGAAPTSAGVSTEPRLPALVPLAVVVGISPLATDMYLPALPALAADLGTQAGVAQLSLTLFLAAFAIGQLVIGPLSDAVGRRRVLLIGGATFVLASVVCALAPSIQVLLAARLLQGLGGAAGAIAGRAMVTDVLAGTRRAQVIGSMAAITAVGPVVAPLVGGALLLVGSWRLTFWTLALLGAVLLVWALLRVTETLPPQRRAHGVGLRASGRRMAGLLRIPRFSLYLATACLAVGGFFAYIATSSFVFQRHYGFSESGYTLLFASNAVCMILSTLLFRRLVGRVGADRLLSLGLLIGTSGSVGVLATALVGGPAGLVWVLLAAVTGSWGLVVTGTAARTQALGRAVPGTAAALVGGLSFGLGALATPLAGLLGGTPVAMGAVMVGGLGIALLLQTLVPRLLRLVPESAED